MIFYRFLKTCWLVVCLIFFGMPMSLAATTLAPVLLEIGASDRVTLTITNRGNRIVPYQLSLLSWKQLGGENQYTPSDDLIISPPSVTLAPGTSREIRIGFRETAPRPDTEAAYRVLIEELPDAPTEPGVTSYIQMLVKHLIPLYVAPANPNPAATLSWTAQQEGEVIRLRAENNSNQRLSIRELAVNTAPNQEPSSGTTRPRAFGRAVVLAKSWQEWTFPVTPQASSRAVTLQITDQFGRISQQKIDLLSR